MNKLKLLFYLNMKEEYQLETEYEVDYKYSKQRITLRYSPDLSKIYVVDKNTSELTEIKLLNKHDNSVIKREKIKLTGGQD